MIDNMPDENDEVISKELQDIIDAIERYTEANKNNVCFVASFVAFKEVPGTICPECKEECDHDIAEDRMLAYGNKEALRATLNELRDLVEDESDDEDFVNC